MVTDRFMNNYDEQLLKDSLAADEFHQGTTVDFFKQFGSITKVYEDEQGPVCFARASKSLRIDVQFLNNGDRQRNAKVLAESLAPLCHHAKESGFTELVFTTSVPELSAFCQKLGFEVVPDSFVLRKFL